MRVQYIAYDGEVFDKEVDCLEYEEGLQRRYDLSGIKFYDRNKKFIESNDKDSSLHAIGQGYYAVIKSENDYLKFKSLLKEYKCGDIVEPYAPGVWAYEFRNNESLWENLTKLHEEIVEILEELK